MKLKNLTERVPLLEVQGSQDAYISGVSIDSRRVAEGHLFVAVRGTQADGHRFIPKAIEQGATAIVCEEIPEEKAEGVTYLKVECSEQVVGQLASNFYGRPSEELRLVGVTGTNGKTTIATVLYNLMRRMGHRVGLLSTVCNYIDDEAVPTDHTTPDPITLNALLRRMVDAGCDLCFMEVSSHSVVQNRIGGLTFTGGIFTNLTRDHLDYHKTFENYLHAKQQFFDRLPAEAFAITNKDDKNGMVMVQNTRAKVYTYSIQGMADFKAKIIESHFEGMYLEIDGQEVGVHFVGRFNVSNLLAVYAAARLLGGDKMTTLVTLSEMRPVSGRFEALRSPDGYTAIVDYAHTPDALENVLRAIHGVLEGRGRVITVCGAGGNRDKGKRPLMAQEAIRQSDLVLLTSDNPRDEEPQAIIDDMLAGLDQEQQRNVITIVDRREAIRTACRMAQKGDVILVAGKGHEDYQEVKGVKHHFDDKEELRAAF
ncbi:MAG: UDP-N-acetylmuramoyl-L-alanyl-D-glutamate--2,6-diaminopimelate ligase [Bacteroidaceae bacterium]|nr:UDP-N-acetylmuramoyl-L-alanyl-D-glutamate--2,6-diaminopimelate ligase [Bacteroidaceae bacterium]MDO4993771.1 UDP-N-acetylmuramoyl-L-alanyl-D-glutamate--2,6-diaminopimelate ligase [Bacteroidales bacterium]